MEPNIDNETSKELSGKSKRAKRINKAKWVDFKETTVLTNFFFFYGNRVFWNFQVTLWKQQMTMRTSQN